MDESEEILLSSLRSSGITLPSNISSLKALTPNSLFSICAQFLHRIDAAPPSFPATLPPATADRFKTCEEMASAIKSLGYTATLGFHQFLYPSDEDAHKLVRFLVVKLSESSEPNRGLTVDVNEPLHTEASANIDEARKTHEKKKADAGGNNQRNQSKDEADHLEHNEMMLIEGKHVKASHIQKQEHDYEILKAAIDVGFNDEQSAEYSTGQPNEQSELRRHSHLSCSKQTQEERETLGLSTDYLESGVQEKLNQLKEIEREVEATRSEIYRREMEHASILAELQKLPKVPPRRSYIERIAEITKNSWKQDADIHRILKETRELQLESNSIQERLDRTYVVVDETVFREAKKDATGRQVYRLLTSIHDSFEQISGKILSTDRARREAADLEAKLTSLSSHSIDISKLQADLESIRKENELLEEQLRIG